MVLVSQSLQRVEMSWNWKGGGRDRERYITCNLITGKVKESKLQCWGQFQRVRGFEAIFS